MNRFCWTLSRFFGEFSAINHHCSPGSLSNVQLSFVILNSGFIVPIEGRLHWTLDFYTCMSCTIACHHFSLLGAVSHSVKITKSQNHKITKSQNHNHKITKSQKEISQNTFTDCNTHQDGKPFTPMRLFRKLEKSLGLPGWKGVRLEPLVLNSSNAWKKMSKRKLCSTRLVFHHTFILFDLNKIVSTDEVAILSKFACQFHLGNEVNLWLGWVKVSSLHPAMLGSLSGTSAMHFGFGNHLRTHFDSLPSESLLRNVFKLFRLVR